MAQASKKAERVASIMKRIISEMLTFEISDPEIGFCTVTDVEVTNDLSFAKVYVTFMDNDEHDEEIALKALTKAKGRFRTACAQQLSTRKCPEIIFIKDTSLEQGNRIDAILAEINRESNSEEK